MPFPYQTKVTTIRETTAPGPVRAAAYRALAAELAQAMQETTNTQERYRLSTLRHDALSRAIKE